MDLCVDFKVSLDDDFAFEVASLCELCVLVVECELMKVMTDDKL